MLFKKVFAVFAAILGASTCSGCSVPRYDIPHDSRGQPNAETIVYRIQCEMRDMVRDDGGSDDVTAFHRKFLLDGDYDVEITLSLEVNDTGGLAPSLSYISPLTAATSYMFSVTGTLSESRDHTFTENIQLSFRSIYADWKTHANPHNCPTADTNLSGTLGLKDFVAIAALTPNLDSSQTLSGKGVFGGTEQFLVTKNLSAIGPAWSLVRFKGPGTASLSEVNTDKLTLAFAQGPNAGMLMGPLAIVRPNPPNKKAHLFLQQLFLGSITSQLNSLQNTLQP
jgi:hypothetical protein